MKNPLVKTLFLPCALCCLSASSDQTPTYLYHYGPFVEGENIDIEMRFLPSRFPNAKYFFVEAYNRTSPSWRFIVNKEVASLSQNSEGYLYVSSLVPSHYLKRGHTIQLNFGLSDRAYYQGIPSFTRYFMLEDAKKIGYESGLIVFEDNTSYDSARESYYYDPRVDKYYVQSYKDGYYVEGMNLGADSSTRKLSLDKVHLFYRNEYTAPSFFPKAELRFSTFREDFASVGVDHGGYVSLPLSVKWAYVREGVYRYDVTGLRNEVHYSRVDLRMFVSKPIEPSFTSKDVYLPTREGHDDQVYRYQIVFDNAGEYGDEVVVSDLVASNKKLFGPCSSAQYCVVIGG